MAQFENHELVGRLLQTTIEVIGRRTSENYAAMAVGNVLENLTKRYVFLKNVEIKNTQFIEAVDAVDVKSGFSNVDSKEVAKASSDFINVITDRIGEHAGFFFIREIKETLPFEYEKTFKELGLDFDVLQMDFILRKSSKFDFEIENTEIIRYVFSILFDVLSKEKTRRSAYKYIDDLVDRYKTGFDVLNYVNVNDVDARGVSEIVSVDDSVNSFDPDKLGSVIQKMLLEVNNFLSSEEVFDFVEKFNNYVGSDYAFKLDQIGVNVKAIKMDRNLVVKRVFKSLIDVLSQSTAESYAVMSLDNILEDIGSDFEFLSYIKIDSDSYSEGIDAVLIADSLDDLSSVTIGRGLQKLIEKVVEFLGEDAGKNFVERFKKRLGRAYVLRIEEMGVNLHMVNLRQNLNW